MAEQLDWVAIFEAETDYVFATLRRFGATPTEAEDLAQEVFLAMWRRRATYDADRPLRPWIAGIAYRVRQRERRRRRHEQSGGIADQADEAPLPDETVDAAQARAVVLRALARLPERQRTVLVLHDLDGLSIRDIAGILATPLFTLYTRLRKGRLAFAKEVRREHKMAARRAVVPAATLLHAQQVPAVPTAVRRRLRERVRALLAGAPEPRAGRGWAPPRPLALAVLSLMAVLLPVPRAVSVPAPPRAVVSTAAAPVAPVGHWRFDGDDRGGSVVRDRSGFGSDCQLRHVDPGRVWGGAGLMLAGRGWLECTGTRGLDRLDEELTIVAWISRGTLLRHYHAVVARQEGAGRRDQFMFGFRDGALMFGSHLWLVRLTAALPPDLPPWFAIAVTRRRDGTIVLYADGRALAHGSTTGGRLSGGSNPLIIGAAVNGPAPARAEARFDGGVKEVLLFDHALPPGMVAALSRRPSHPSWPDLAMAGQGRASR